MSSNAAEGAVIEHETGHAAGLMYLGCGVRWISIRPDHEAYAGQTVPQMDVRDMPGHHRILALMTGPRAERGKLTDELETTIDLKRARSLVRARLDLESDRSPEVTEQIQGAWDVAGEILERTADYRSAVRDRLQKHRPFNDKRHVEVADLWDTSIGYHVEFSERNRLRSASLSVDGEPAGHITFAEEEGTGGVPRRLLIQAEVPERFRNRGHAHHLVLAIRAQNPRAVLVDGPSQNTEDGEGLLAHLRRRITIHDHDCFRNGQPCVCGREV